jgi:tRNA1Val (adenine37-N6)-methyltransferase
MVDNHNGDEAERFQEVPVKEDEELQDLLHGELVILQKKTGYRFSVDPILLTAFVDLRDGDRVIDLGTGSGVMPLILAARAKVPNAAFVGLELQESIVDMAERSVAANRLEDRIDIQRGDIRRVRDEFETDSFDVVISNPPYIPVEKGTINPEDAKAYARHEVTVKLADVVGAARYLSKSKGRVYFIYPVIRLVDLLAECRAHQLEPRRIQFVHANQNSGAKLAMVETIRDAGVELKVLRPIFVYNMEGGYTEEVAEILNESDKLT